MKSSRTTAQVAMFLSGFLMGFVGLFVSFFSTRSIYTIVTLRGLFGCLWFALFFFLDKKWGSFRSVWKQAPLGAIGQGVTGALCIFFYFNAIALLDYATAAFLLYLAPILTVLVKWIFLKNKPQRISFIAFPIALLGLFFILAVWDGTANAAGLIYGVLSGITLCLSQVIRAKIFADAEHLSEEAQKSLYMPLAFLTTLALFFGFVFSSDLASVPLSRSELGVAILLGLLPTALPFYLFNIGLGKDDGGDLLILTYSEPVMAALLSVIVDQTLAWFTLVGGALILLANILSLLSTRQKAYTAAVKLK